jgi:naphtho-gamma-pyrone polyketide synthase
MLSLQCHFDNFNGSQTLPRSWSAIISAKHSEASRLIERFYSSQHQHDEDSERNPSSFLNVATTPYLSAVSMTNVTVSAPPAILDRFLSFSKVQSRKLLIESPYHAAHLFPESTCLAAVEQFHDSSLSAYKLQMPLLSPTGGQIEAGNFKEILETTVYQTLRCQIRWDQVVQSSYQLLQRQGMACEIIPMHSNAAQLLSKYIPEKSGIDVTVNDVHKSSPEVLSMYPTGKFEHSKIAIIGFSGRYPDAASNEEFWNLLHEGRDVHRKIPEDRFDGAAHFDPTGKTKNTSKVQHGCFIKEPGLFDTRFFNMSPREAASTDPAQRLLITATYEALEMAGFVPNRTPSTQVDRVGVFMGTTSDDWREVNSGQDVDTYFIPGGNRAFVPGRISYFFKFSGPSLSIDTACSSSFSAIHAACSYLWKGDCDSAVAGGTNILTNPDNFAGLDRGHFLSTTGNCKPFDDAADGYCRADAVGSIILKRYEDAIADNDPIYGMIAGAHTNHCGQAESITRPHEGDQASVFNRVLRYTNQNPLDVSYVEMHGTGTQAGDATEMNSVLSCFVPGRQRTPSYPLHIGSAKANIGHAESASGVSSLIKVLLMMKNQEIPPHCGIKATSKINHNYPKDLAERNVHIAFKPTPWTREGCVSGKRIAFLNNFSAAGGNTALLLEDGPERAKADPDLLRPTYPVCITAKSAKSLETNAKAMLSFLKSDGSISLPNLSYTTTARRIHHNFRIMVAGADLKSVQLNLEGKLSNLPDKPIPNAVLIPKIAFAFTGQGSLYVGVGKDLFISDKNFRSDILRFDFIAQQCGMPSFLALIDGSASARQLEQPTIAHVGHACLQMALFNMWTRYGVTPALVVGHSLGEYAALYASGALSATDTIHLVGTRARLLEESCTPRSHSMVSVKASESEISAEVRRSSEVACINQPDATVLSGPRDEVDRVTEELEGQGRKCVKLDIPYAFHSAQVEPILDSFENHERAIRFSKPTVPFLSPMLTSVISETDALNDSYLTKACRRPVDFQGALQAAMQSGAITDKTIFLELGPHPICSGMIKSTLGADTLVLPTLQKRIDSWVSVVSALEKLYVRGISVDWNEFYRQDSPSLQVIELPQYGWDLKNHWIQYRNNFCLTKGDDPTSGVLKPEAATAVVPSIITPSVQRVVELNKNAPTIITETDIGHPALANVVQGHKVNSVALCPSSLYADMAMTAVEQFLRAIDMSTEGISFDVGDMKVAKPLVASGSKQLLRVSASVDVDQKEAALSFYSVSPSGSKLADHATCQVRICENATRKDEWRRMSFLINHRLDALDDSVHSGCAHKMKRGIVYKLFSSLVDYSPGYRGMEEVTLDSAELEATAKVRFQCGAEGFGLNPQWIDSLGHIAGFIMNANDSVVSKDMVFVNHGWDNMEISTAFSEDKTYRTYNRMQLTTNNLYVGDTYILENKEIVAIFSGIKVSRSCVRKA